MLPDVRITSYFSASVSWQTCVTGVILRKGTQKKLEDFKEIRQELHPAASAESWGKTLGSVGEGRRGEGRPWIRGPGTSDRAAA